MSDEEKKESVAVPHEANEPTNEVPAQAAEPETQDNEAPGSAAPEQSDQTEQTEQNDDNNDNNDENDDEQYDEEHQEEAEEADMDEEVYKLKAHRRATPAAKEKARTERRRERRATTDDSDATPAGVARTKSKPSSRGASQPQEGEEFVEEDLPLEEKERRELEERIDAALAPASRRRKKLSADDIEMLQDDAIAKLRDEMRRAALEDVECIQQGMPAVNKVRMLPQVVRVLQMGHLADSILDGNLLESVRIWLEPLPDASLPSFEIQKALFQALTTLPIKTIHLRESGLGRVVLFYQRSKRPHSLIKRLAQKLIGDWTRPIIGRSDNYRDKRVVTTDFDPSRGSALDRQATSRGSASSSYEESANRRNRAAIPMQGGVNYQVAPVSNIQNPEQVGQTKDSQLRRMKTKLMANRSKGRKNQVSVEGKELH